MAIKKKTPEEIREEKKANAGNALQMLQSKYGIGSIGLLGKMPTAKVIAVSTGIPDLDLAIGVSGMPLGRIVEVFGGEASGKTTTCLAIIASAQRLKHKCAFIDAENAMDPDRAKVLGVDLDTLLFTQPESAEQALDIAYDIAESGEYSFIVIDSVSALVPAVELEAEMDKNTIGLQARLLSKACRKFTSVLQKNKCTLIFINQLREKIGGYSPNGNTPTTTSGGRALKFFSSIRMEVKKGDVIGTYEEQQGHTVKLKIVKNKVSAPFKKAEYDIYSDDRGIDTIKGLIKGCVETNVLYKGGSWHYYPTKDAPETIDGVLCKWQSAGKAADDIRSSKVLYDLLYAKFTESFREMVRVAQLESENSTETEAEGMTDDEIVEAILSETDNETNEE